MWIEILSRHHDVTARQRCAGETIRIGRGYDNDVILDDPFVAPHHLRLQRTEEGGWEACDLGSANGIRVERNRTRLDRVALDDDRIIRIGHTLLRLRSAAHPVAAERVDIRQVPLWPIAAVLVFAIIGLEVLGRWLAETEIVRPADYVASLGPIGVFTAMWFGVWTTLCRVFTGHARFERHLVIPLAGVFAYSLADEAMKYLGYALSWPTLAGNEYVVLCALLALVTFGHLHALAPRSWRLSASVVAGLAVLAIGAEVLALNEAHRTSDPPPIQGRYYPPALRLVPPETDGQFFGDVAKLRAKLDAGRQDDDR